MSRVLIVNMPFFNLRWPNLGPSLLKAALTRRGIGCDIAYLNFDFAERVGLEHYGWIADSFAFVLGGERFFARHYFGNELPDEESYHREVLLAADPDFSEADRRAYEQTFGHVEPFLEACMAAIDWPRYDVVGFATSFQQTLPSLCLARRIKQLRPQTRIIFGGAACEGEMGLELLRRLPAIDYVFLGEADLTFPPVVEQLLSGRPVELPPGVAARDSTTDQLPPACCDLPPLPEAERFLVRKLDALPYPDFDDYFRRLQASPLRAQVEPLLFFETSRGCWWGEKNQCAFCGLNGGALGFRSKSPQRAVDELRYLVGRHGIRRACSSDNILDPRYFQTFLPMLREAGLGLTFVYEMKTNLTRPQVEILVAAGLGAAQLGIETFSTSLLKLVGKGATALQNVQALKWFSEAGVEVKWNFLYGFPNEDPADYALLADLLPSLYHLAPPAAAGRVRMDRFSPYFRNAAAYGMSHARPHRAFRYVYPFPPEALARLAYYYEYDYADGRDPLSYAAPALKALETWQQLQGTVTLRSWDRPDGVLILTDTRPDAAALQRFLSGTDRAVYLYCDSGRSWREIVEFARQSAAGGSQPLEETSLRQTLEQWLAQRLMVCLDDRYLSLAVRGIGD
jgi:ribosomal peptide maturation radical SAM protein 1